MIDLPNGFPMWTNDLKTIIKNDNPPQQLDSAHNALSDAQWNRATYYWLQRLRAGSS